MGRKYFFTKFGPAPVSRKLATASGEFDETPTEFVKRYVALQMNDATSWTPWENSKLKGPGLVEGGIQIRSFAVTSNVSCSSIFVDINTTVPQCARGKLDALHCVTSRKTASGGR